MGRAERVLVPVPETYSRNAVIIPADCRCDRKRVLSGWACRARSLGRGERLIYDFVLPGEIVGPPLRTAAGSGAYAVLALTTVTACAVRGREERHPGSAPPGADPMDVEAAREESSFLSTIYRLNKMCARRRLSHLLLELHGRLSRSLVAGPEGFPLPIPKSDLADHLGLSPQHLNRSLNELHAAGILGLRPGWIEILSRRGLEEDAGYSPRERSWPASETS